MIEENKTEVKEKEMKIEKEKAESVKKEGNKKELGKIEKKEFSVAVGSNFHMSKKQGMYICTFIKKKKIDDAINELEKVKMYKKAIPFKGEVPHRKGMMSGRYPVKAAGIFISLLKGLKGNSIVNGLDLDKTIIYEASASWGVRPMRSGRRQGKRTNIILKARELTGKEKEARI